MTKNIAKLRKCRSSCPELFCKKDVLKNFVKLTGKHLRQSLFFNKVADLADLSPATLLKKRLWHRCFPVNFAKFLRTSFYRTLLVASSGNTPLRTIYLKTIKWIVPWSFRTWKTYFNPLSANPTKWSNTTKEFAIVLNVFDLFEGLALKGLTDQFSWVHLNSFLET